MSIAAHALPRYRAWRHRAFSWRYELPVAGKVALAFGMAAATGVLAQIRIALPFTPVPITGQVLGVLLAGVMLGRFYGGLSQGIYVGLGAVGMPWFAGLSGGFAALSGVTGGYLVGFVVAAEFIGYASDRYVGMRHFWPQFCLMLLGVAVIYACGAVQFSIVLHAGLKKTFLLGVLPFVPVDAAKAVIAAFLSTALLPKASYDGEVDAARYPKGPH